jgi:AIPR protein
MLDLSYPKMLGLFQQHLDPKRTESASFLIWYFENYLRLGALEALDSVCDQNGDRGIDGIYVNEDANIIEVYQSKISQKEDATIGDRTLREFAGSIAQFDSVESLNTMLTTVGDAEIGKLVNRLNIIRRLPEFEVVGIFLSNAELDANGQAFLSSFPRIRFVGREMLQSSYVSPTRDHPVSRKVDFDISGFETTKYVVDEKHEAIIAPIKASELVALDGISNQALFSFNVRGPLGRTQVNKDIASSVRDSSLHKFFPLFHNGITIIAATVERGDESIGIEQYFVVNGCQSLTELFNNRRHLTGDLRVLVKFIKAAPSSPLAEMVTRFSNNQNGVKARDFKSNNPIQIRLQNEVRRHYGTEFFYEIKRGEENGGLEVISNETAGLYLMAYDLKSPWTTHRKYQVFEDRHADIFGRPIVNAHRIVFCHLLTKRIDSASRQLKNTLFAKYVLAKYLLLYILRLIFEKDEIGQQLIDKPETFLCEPKARAAALSSVDAVLVEIVTDINAELDTLGPDFDYREKLRNEKWAKDLANEIVSTHEKLVSRKRLDSLTEVYRKEVAALNQTA